MSRTRLWIITALLIAGFIGIRFVYIPSRHTDLQRRGKTGYASVTAKDSHPVADEDMVYTITFIFPDEQNRNHQVTVRMLDKGRWDSLKVKDDVKCRYLPEDPENASLEGAERMIAPHSSALGFIAWSLFFASAVTGYFAYRAPKPEGKSKPRNKVTVSRH